MFLWDLYCPHVCSMSPGGNSSPPSAAQPVLSVYDSIDEHENQLTARASQTVQVPTGKSYPKSPPKKDHTPKSHAKGRRAAHHSGCNNMVPTLGRLLIMQHRSSWRGGSVEQTLRPSQNTVGTLPCGQKITSRFCGPDSSLQRERCQWPLSANF